MSGTVTKNKKITLIHKLAYGSGNMLGSGALAISGAWLLYFYTTFCNMSVVKATLIFSIATYLDVILNPLMGFITDSFTELSWEESLDEEDSLSLQVFRLCFFIQCSG